jgi:ATP-binding cassette subfamily F protein 3
VLTFRHVDRDYGERRVLHDLSLTIERGERLALIGPNGAGKSTLLRLMAGIDRPTRGTVAHGVGLRAAYFAQDQAEQLDPDNTVFDEVYEAAPASWDIQDVRDLLGRFLFTGDGQFAPVAGLSGGERSRVALAKLLLRPSNLLLLDEPTNHLDIATRERLEETLSGYTGTLVFATHDRYLVDRLATQVVEVEPGHVQTYVGNYSAYRRVKDAAAAADVVETAPARRVEAVRANGDQRTQRRLAAEVRELERQVNEADARRLAIEQQLSEPAALDTETLQQLAHEHAALSAEVAVLTERWVEKSEEGMRALPAS